MSRLFFVLTLLAALPTFGFSAESASAVSADPFSSNPVAQSYYGLNRNWVAGDGEWHTKRSKRDNDYRSSDLVRQSTVQAPTGNVSNNAVSAIVPTAALTVLTPDTPSVSAPVSVILSAASSSLQPVDFNADTAITVTANEVVSTEPPVKQQTVNPQIETRTPIAEDSGFSSDLTPLVSTVPTSANVPDAEFSTDLTMSVPTITSQKTASDESSLKSVSLSGILSAQTYYGLNSKWLSGEGRWLDNRFSSVTDGDLFLDIRFQKGYKAWLDLWFADIGPSPNILSLKEAFVDLNLDQTTWVRAGRQVLAWGRSYFFTPLDLTNSGSKSISSNSRTLSGTNGLKITTALGDNKTAYLFANTEGATNFDTVSLSGKVEWIAGTTEFALSGWTRYKQPAQFGFDFSTSVNGLNVMGEYGLLSRQSELGVMENPLYSALCMTVMKNLNWELPERISLIWEGYFDGRGFSNSDQLFQALFCTVTKFPISSTSVQFNLLMNHSDGSSNTNLIFTWEPVDRCTLNFGVNIYAGPASSSFVQAGEGNSIVLDSAITMTF